MKYTPCPTCEGKLPLEARDICFTCSGTGRVYPGEKCRFCGRSIQREVKGVKICMNEACLTQVNEAKSADTDDYLSYAMRGLYDV